MDENGKWINLHNEELQRILRGTGYVDRIEEMSAFRILTSKPAGEKS